MKTGRSGWALVGVVARSVLLLLAGYVAVYFAVVDWNFFDGERAPLYITPFDATYKTVDRSSGQCMPLTGIASGTSGGMSRLPVR